MLAQNVSLYEQFVEYTVQIPLHGVSMRGMHSSYLYKYCQLECR